MRRALLALGVLALLAAAPAHARPIDTGKGTAAAYASGVVKEPRKLFVTATASPLQPIEISWDVTCTATLRFKFRDGTFEINSGERRRLPRPLRHPTRCSVSASALETNFFVDTFLTITLSAKR